jgi:hypothetical protein
LDLRRTMGTDYAEKERTFIASLEADTGRGLEGWLMAITATGLTDRNEIIDWLRQNRFTFSNASWIERIHHNGGRLVYAEGGEPHIELPPPLPGLAPEVVETAGAKTAMPVAEPPPLPSPHVEINPLLNSAVTEVLASAKGLRPLAELILREISVAVPAAMFDAADPFVKISAPKPFASLLMGPKRLLLYADFGGAGTTGIKAGAAVAKAAPPYPQMLVLDDARKIDQAFRDVIKAVHARADIGAGS